MSIPQDCELQNARKMKNYGYFITFILHCDKYLVPVKTLGGYQMPTLGSLSFTVHYKDAQESLLDFKKLAQRLLNDFHKDIDVSSMPDDYETLARWGKEKEGAGVLSSPWRPTSWHLYASRGNLIISSGRGCSVSWSAIQPGNFALWVKADSTETAAFALRVFREWFLSA